MNHQPNKPSEPVWYSRLVLSLFVFLGIASFLLLYEHRAHVFTGNGFLIGLLVLCIGMHLFMHGGHGGHSGGHGHDAPTNREED